MEKNDVVVIGGGLSGLFAACVAAERGKKVTLLSYGEGALRIGGGVIDVLGYDDAGQPVKNPIRALAEAAPDHPYAKVGTERAAEAFTAFLKMTAAAGYEFLGGLEQNQWIPTAVGAFKPTCLTPRTMDGAALVQAKEVLVVGVDLLKDFYAPMVRKNLEKYFGRKKKIAEAIVKLPFDGRRDLRDVGALDAARWLDGAEGRASFAEQLKGKVKPGMVLVVAPVLGTAPNYQVLDAIEADLGCKLVEASSMPPAVTGYRLSKLLHARAAKLGVRMVPKAKVVAAEVTDGRCECVLTEGFDRTRRYGADAFILATGGVFGGGLTTKMGEMTEPIMGLSIPVPAVQTEWSHDQLLSPRKQIFARYGVSVDRNLSPLADGRVVADNVRVVGRTLAGYDYCFEKSGNGVALATAYQAAISL